MRRVACAAVFLFVCPIVLAQGFHSHHVHLSATAGSPCTEPFVMDFANAEIREGMPTVKWPVTTAIPDAQTFFNQGITEYYGFNYEAAMRNFRKAQQLDPTMPMAAWGIALATGPNINLGMDDTCREIGTKQSADAVTFAGKRNITEVEKGLIQALPLRYAGPMTETVAYSVAMRQVWEDLTAKTETGANVANVGALYAESLFDMRPWGLYDAAYRPALDTDAIHSILAIAMAAETEAIGANHLYIHAIEASATPQCGLNAANLLDSWTRKPKLAEAPAHLVHMPSHIYIRVGDYLKAKKSNIDAVSADEAQYGAGCADPSGPTCPQLYYGHYGSHDLFFQAVAAAFAGQRDQAMRAARATCKHARRFVGNEPGLERYMTAPVMMLVMNQKWPEILDAKLQPPDDCSMEQFPGFHILGAMWHWARGVAFASRREMWSASAEYKLMADEMARIQPPGPTGWGNNSAAAMLAVAQSMLQAQYTWGGGGCQEDCAKSAIEQGIEHLKLAVTHEDALVYDEPQQWLPPTREALGGAYLRAAQSPLFAKTQTKLFELAELTFDEELARHPGSGRALYGRYRALAGQGSPKADNAKKDFCKAWGEADYSMSETELWPPGYASAAGPFRVTCEAAPVIPPTPPACPQPVK